MGRVKTAWTLEQENREALEWDDFIEEIRAFTKELKDDNDRAEIKENERARQRISIREV